MGRFTQTVLDEEPDKKHKELINKRVMQNDVAVLAQLREHAVAPVMHVQPTSCETVFTQEYKNAHTAHTPRLHGQCASSTLAHGHHQSKHAKLKQQK